MEDSLRQNGIDENKYKSDDKAFLFSLNNKEIYPILYQYKNMAINCCDELYAPVFGNDIYITNGFFSNNLNIAQESYYYYKESKIKDDYILAGQKYFSVSEMEVYEVLFDEN